jgi:hypothetical protein
MEGLTMASNGKVLRIYWGDARFTLAADDPRVPKILAMMTEDVGRAAETPTGRVALCTHLPKNDAEFLAVAQGYFARRPAR